MAAGMLARGIVDKLLKKGDLDMPPGGSGEKYPSEKYAEGDEDSGEESPMKVPDAGAVAGKRFADALKGGDGAAIKQAFQALLEECQGPAPDMEEI